MKEKGMGNLRNLVALFLYPEKGEACAVRV